MKKRKRGSGRNGCKKWCALICIGLMTGMGISAMTDMGKVNAAAEKAVANKTWESVKPVIEQKLGMGYHEVGMCTGYLYWCLTNAYGVDWGTNSYVDGLEEKLIANGITKVAEGTSGEITKDMKPGDIIIFIDGTSRSHCAILGENGLIYHASNSGVACGPTLAEWMALPHEAKNCDSYTVYRGLDSTGSLTITKTAANEDMTVRNKCYSLKGAEYGLYQETALIGTLTTDSNGEATLTNIPYGSYTLKEIKAPEGYALDDTVYDIVVDSEMTTKKLKDNPQSAVVDAVLYKIDREIHETWSQENTSQFGASLKGAEYTVKYYDGYYDDNTAYKTLKPVRSWVLKTDENGKIILSNDYLVMGDPFYYNSSGQAVLPLGTITIQETKAPEGYMRDSTLHVRQINAEGTSENVDTYNIPTHTEQIIRGDVELIKVRDDSLTRLAGIPFTLTSISTGEQYTMVTDINGYASTASDWNLHTSDTNMGQASSGIWFGDPEKVDDDRGALPYGTYILDEQPCDANAGMSLVGGIEIVIYKNNMTIDLGTITNDMINIETTAAVMGEQGQTAPAEENVMLADLVAYDGLTAGKEYKLEGTVYDKAAKTPLIIEGKKVESTVNFVPESKTGTTEISFSIDTSQLAGKDIVIFERLYDGEQLAAIHEDINNKNQTIHIEETEVAEVMEKSNEESNKEDGNMKGSNNVKTGDGALKKVILAVNFMVLSAAAACAALLKEKRVN